ncbi:hypothetical protein C1Y40_05215 [Mycobacterium talmoniae]|uniref:Uncharacterized protein n=1 Tax=Mycobacterium talmoniae TaxID=1858794 RepID=A0A2S8BD83_9MYCO|nr:hypothetical protein C1Y40_05215 [Mycobacterium talmoniae]
MPSLVRSFLATSTAPVLLKSSRSDTTYGRSGCGGRWAGLGTTVTLGTSLATRLSSATASSMSL